MAVWPVLGGEPRAFSYLIYLFLLGNTDGVSQTSSIPLEVKGTESRQTSRRDYLGMVQKLGGIFREEIDSIIPYGGVGIVKFTGSLMGSDQVTGTVPPDCMLR